MRKILHGIYKSLLLCILTFSTIPFLNKTEAANGDILFNQDFTGAAVQTTAGAWSLISSTDYVATTNPTSSQFTCIQAGKQSSSYVGCNLSANTSKLYVNSQGTGFNWAVTRNVDLAASAPTALKIEFTTTIATNSSSASPKFWFQVGQGFSNDGTSANVTKPTDANVHSGFSIAYAASSGIKVFYNDGTTSMSSTAIGTSNYTWTMIVNNSGQTITYTNPAGNSTTVANDTYDLYVGSSTQLGNDIPATTGTVPITQFKFGDYNSNGRAIWSMDVFKITDMTPGTPSWTLAENSQVSSGNLLLNSTNNIISRFSLANSGTASGNLTALTFNTAGTYAAADVNNFKLYYSATNLFPGGTALATISSSLGTGAHTFSSLSQAIATSGTGYFWITSDVASGATAGNTINVSSIANTDLTYSAGASTGSASAGGVQTIVAYPAIALTSGSNTTTVNVNNAMTSAVYTYSNVSSDASVVGAWYTDNTYTTPATAPNGLSISQNTGAKTMTVGGTPANGVYGTFYYKMTVNETNGNSINGSITVNVPTPTITLTSATGTNTQTVKAGAALTNITYSVTNATSATIGTLPTGLNGAYNNGTFTISGTVDNAATLATTNFTVTANPYTGYAGSSITSTGSINVKSATAKTILFLANDTVTATFDRFYANLLSNNNYVVIKRAAQASFSGNYNGIDLIILHESLTGSDASVTGHELRLVKDVDKPILNLKSFVYNNGTGNNLRWSWGAPNSGNSAKGIKVIQTSHPIFSGITITDSLYLYGSYRAKNIQPTTSTIGGYLIAKVPGGISIHDIPASIRLASGTSKYLLISLLNGAFKDLTNDALSLLNNSMDYLINGTQFAAPSLNISSFTVTGTSANIDEGVTPKTITGTVGFSQTMTAITPTIALAGTGTTVSPASGVSTSFATNPVAYTVTDGINSKVYNVTLSQNAAPLPSDYYRLATDGDISTPGSWESSDDNIHWKTSTVAPTSAAAQLNIQNGKELTINSANTELPQLVVSAGGKVTITSGSSFTATSVTLQSNSSSTATFVDANTNSNITATVQQYLPQGRNWYVGIPVSSGSAGALTAAGLGTSVSYYDEPSSTWIYDYTGALTPGKGYIAASSTGTGTNNASFSGTLNTGDVTVSLSRQGSTKAGFNLIANPYPSYLNAMAAINANADMVKTIWYRTKSSAYYFETVNTTSGVGTNTAGTGTVTGYIPPMQAFWVRTNVDNNSITFTNAMRYHAGNVATDLGSVPTTVMKTPSATKAVNQILRLQVSNGINSDEAVIYTNDNAVNGLDAYDSPKMSNANAAIPEIYTTAGNENLVINGLNSIQADMEIPVGFYTGQTNSFAIKATEMSNFSGTQVLLKDNVLNTTTDITDGSAYTFNSGATTTTSRFSLIFKVAGVTTAVSGTSDNKDVLVYKNANKQIAINCRGAEFSNGSASVYNAVGQKVADRVITGTTTVLGNEFTPGTYIVTVTMNGKTSNSKIVIE